MLHKLRQRAQSEKGFTLIELLVVILIIGILAAIALPAFLGQRSKAQDTEAKTAARTAQTAFETLYVDEQSYVAANNNAAALRKIEPALTDANITAITGSADAWSVTVESVTDSTFTITKTVANGVPTIARSCTPPSTGGCSSTSDW